MARAGKLAFSGAHDEGEFDGDGGEDQDTEFLEADAAHIDVNSGHQC